MHGNVYSTRKVYNSLLGTRVYSLYSLLDVEILTKFLILFKKAVQDVPSRFFISRKSAKTLEVSDFEENESKFVTMRKGAFVSGSVVSIPHSPTPLPGVFAPPVSCGGGDDEGTLRTCDG